MLGFPNLITQLGKKTLFGVFFYFYIKYIISYALGFLGFDSEGSVSFFSIGFSVIV